MNVFFHNFYHIIYTSEKITSILTNLSEFSDLIVNIIAIIGGIFGFMYIKDLKRKRMDATFSFFSRLCVRIKQINYFLTNYKKEIIIYLSRPSETNSTGEIANSFSPSIIKSIAANSNETLEFLKSSDNQIPISNEWLKNYNDYLELLQTLSMLENKNFYLWEANIKDEEKENFLSAHQNNLNQMIQMIATHQAELEQKINKKDVYQRSKKYFQKKLKRKKDESPDNADKT